MKRAAFIVVMASLTIAAAAQADDAGVEESVSGCVAHVPEGASLPAITEAFPTRGTSGYAATLTLTIEHGKGEAVLPRGLDLQSAGEAAKVLKSAGFVLPEQDGGAGARLTPETSDKPDRARTRLELPVVPLPDTPGRHTLTLPPLPVAVARASGDIVTACTKPHMIVVEDPTAQEPDAKPLPNPPPRPQREEWTALKYGLAILSAGLLLGAIVAYLVRRWMQRPRPVKPPPPPRPPWDVALERLDEVRHAGLLEMGRFGEYFDRVSDAVRWYLGARYGWDGLECTTDEMIARLRTTQVQGLSLPEIVAFLQECDLVKFANFTPDETECTRAIHEGERIVRLTVPRARAFDGTEVRP